MGFNPLIALQGQVPDYAGGMQNALMNMNALKQQNINNERQNQLMQMEQQKQTQQGEDRRYKLFQDMGVMADNIVQNTQSDEQANAAYQNMRRNLPPSLIQAMQLPESVTRAQLGEFSAAVKSKAPVKPTTAMQNAAFVHPNDTEAQRDFVANSDSKSGGKTSNQKDFDTYQDLKKTDPESALEFGRAAGFVNKEGQELSVHLQKRLSDATDAATESRINAEEFNSLADQFENSTIKGGLFGSTWAEALKEFTGSQDADSILRKRYYSVRASEVVKNLPPGAASDTDIALAMQGFPSEKANKEQIASFLRGTAKLEMLADEYNTFKAKYISEKGTERGLLEAWRETKSPSQEQPTDDDLALEWAQANPNDPRAQKIMKLLGR